MRLFIAIDVPDTVRAALQALSEKLRPTTRDARWVRMDGVHITLKFIGEVASEKTEEIRTALANVKFHFPIPIHFIGLNYFPNDRRPRVLWAGVRAGSELSTLAAAVKSAIEPLGIPRENLEFSPHVTLARFDPQRRTGSLHALQTAIEQAGPLDFGYAVAKEFHLYRSILKRGGAEYTRMATFCSREAHSQ